MLLGHCVCRGSVLVNGPVIRVKNGLSGGGVEHKTFCFNEKKFFPKYTPRFSSEKKQTR